MAPEDLFDRRLLRHGDRGDEGNTVPEQAQSDDVSAQIEIVDRIARRLSTLSFLFEHLDRARQRLQQRTRGDRRAVGPQRRHGLE